MFYHIRRFESMNLKKPQGEGEQKQLVNCKLDMHIPLQVWPMASRPVASALRPCLRRAEPAGERLRGTVGAVRARAAGSGEQEPRQGWREWTAFPSRSHDSQLNPGVPKKVGLIHLRFFLGRNSGYHLWSRISMIIRIHPGKQTRFYTTRGSIPLTPG